MAKEEVDPIGRLGQEVERLRTGRELDLVMRTRRNLERVAQRAGKGVVDLASGARRGTLPERTAMRAFDRIASSTGLGRFPRYQEVIPHPSEAFAHVEPFEEEGHIVLAGGLVGPTISKGLREENAHAIRSSLFYHGYLHNLRHAVIFSMAPLTDGEEYSDGIAQQMEELVELAANDVNGLRESAGIGASAVAVKHPISITGTRPVTSIVNGLNRTLYDAERMYHEHLDPEDTALIGITTPPVAENSIGIEERSLRPGSTLVLTGQLHEASMRVPAVPAG